MVSKRESPFKVKRIDVAVWSQRENRHLRSKELTDACVREAESVSQGEILIFLSNYGTKKHLQTWYIFYLKSHPKCSTI